MSPDPTELEVIASDTIKRVVNHMPVKRGTILILCGAALAGAGQTRECNRLRGLAVRLGAKTADLFPPDEVGA